MRLAPAAAMALVIAVSPAQRRQAEIVTTFAFDANLQVAVPVEMRERYLRESEITGVATYGRFRRFGVRTEEQIK